MKDKILIVGRGLAGSILSLKFIENNIPHEIIDEPTLSSSSKVAAGIINPIVLKRLRLVDDAERFWVSASSFYAHWEKEFGHSFYQPIPIHHFFQSMGEQNDWVTKSGEETFSNFLGSFDIDSVAQFNPSHGFGKMKNTAWLDTGKFLNLHLNSLEENKTSVFEKKIEPAELLEISENYKTVILCNGHLMQKLFPVTQSWFSPTRGELIIIETKELDESAIWHGPVFILPLGNHRFKVGSTFHWDNLEDIPTDDGLKKLETALQKIFTGNYVVVEHYAGVRPNTRDRKPILGHLKGNIYCFNGLGSRGALMAPHLAEVLSTFLSNNGSIPTKWDLKRFG